MGSGTCGRLWRGDLRTVDFGVPGLELPKNTDIALNQISADYFRALKVPLLKGRFFTDGDSENSQPVVILNRAAAERYFGGDDAIGKVVRLAGLRTVVGIVGNIRPDGPEGEWRTQAFVPFAQSRVPGATLILRTTPHAAGILPAVRQAIRAEFPRDLPSHVVEQPLDFYYDGLVAQRRLNMLLLLLFGRHGPLGAALAGAALDPPDDLGDDRVADIGHEEGQGEGAFDLEAAGRSVRADRCARNRRKPQTPRSPGRPSGYWCTPSENTPCAARERPSPAP